MSAQILNWIICKKCNRKIEGTLYKLKCHHYACSDCYKGKKLTCCNDSQSASCCGNVSMMARSLARIPELDRENTRLKKVDEENKKLVEFEAEIDRLRDSEKENKELKEKLASLEAQLNKKLDDPIDCSDCKECYTEKKMYFCKTCSENIENASTEKQEEQDSKSIGVCPNCVVMDHIVQKHEVVPLFPILAEIQYKTYAKAIDEKKSGVDENCTNIVEMSKGLVELSEILKKYADTTAGMIKTSKSSTFQAEFNQLINQHIDEFKETITKLDEYVTSDYEKLKEMLTNFNSQVSEMCNDKCTNVDDGEVFRTDCNHYFCITCKINHEKSNGTGRVYCCNSSYRIVTLCGDTSKIRNSFKELEDRNNQLTEKLNSLDVTVVELKAQLNKKPDDPIDCSDCKECYTERKMYICKTCSENTAKSSKKKNKKHDLKSAGLCSNCVVMDHIIQKHEVVPLFPVLAETQYKAHSVDIDQKKQTCDEKFTKSAELWKGLEELSDIFKKYIDTTTGMIKTSKSSTFQLEFKEFISLKVNEFNDKIGGVEDHLKSDVDKLNEMLTNFNSQVSEMCNDRCTNVDEIVNALKQLMEQHQSVGNKRKADSTDA